MNRNAKIEVSSDWLCTPFGVSRVVSGSHLRQGPCGCFAVNAALVEVEIKGACSRQPRLYLLFVRKQTK